MKLSAWAKSIGISYKTAHRMFQSGTLPIKAEQLSTGTILVYPEKSDYLNDNDKILKSLHRIEHDLQRIKHHFKI